MREEREGREEEERPSLRGDLDLESGTSESALRRQKWRGQEQQQQQPSCTGQRHTASCLHGGPFHRQGLGLSWRRLAKDRAPPPDTPLDRIDAFEESTTASTTATTPTPSSPASSVPASA